MLRLSSQTTASPMVLKHVMPNAQGQPLPDAAHHGIRKSHPILSKACITASPRLLHVSQIEMAMCTLEPTAKVWDPCKFGHVQHSM